MMSAERRQIPMLNQGLTYRRWLLLALIVLMAAAAFRLVALQEVPPGLAQDEVLDADIASFIRAGENALFFSHGYGHEPLYHYWAAPFRPIFGDNVLAIRLPSVFLGLLLVALTMRWARREYGATAAVVAGIGLAISWWPIIFSRIGIRPILEPVILAIAVWFWPLGRGVLTRRGVMSAALAGLFLGLSIYTYTAARIILLIPLLLLAVFAIQYLWARRTSASEERVVLRAQIVYAAVVIMIGTIVYLPLAMTLRANPGLQQRLEQLEGPLTALRDGNVVPVLRTTLATLGVFSFTGDPRWTYSLPGRPLFDPLTAVLFYVGLAAALWRWRQPRYALLPIWLFVALLPSALSPDAPSTVRLIGALPIIYLLPGLAVGVIVDWVRLIPLTASRKRRFQSVGLFLLLALLGINGYRSVRDGFFRWPRDLETRLRYQSALWDIGRYWRDNASERSLVVADIFYEPIDDATLRRSIGADPEARWIQTGAGVAGALVWPLGQPANLYVPEYAPLDPDLVRLAGLDDQPVFRSGGPPSFALYQLPLEPLAGRNTTKIEFGVDPSIIILAGVTDPVVKGNQLSLASWWIVVGDLPSDIAVFVHLIGEGGEIFAQYDGLDAAANALQPGDILLQRHVLELPDGVSPGRFALRMGLYRRSDGQRIPLQTGDDAIEVATCLSAGSSQEGLVCRLTVSH